MRLSTLFQFSTAIAFPAFLLTLPKAGSHPVDSSVPLAPNPNKPIKPQMANRSALAVRPVTSTIAPEGAKIPSIAAPQFSASFPKPSIASPQSAFSFSLASLQVDLPWDRIVERSMPASVVRRSNSRTATPAPKKNTNPTASKKNKPSTPQPSQVLTKADNSPLPTIAPADSFESFTPTETPYVLGTGDTIQLTVVNVPEFSGQQQIGSDGSILLPVVGRVGIAGLSVPEAEAAIARRLSRELRRPRILLNVLKSRPLRIGIAGEIKQPGFYTLSAAEAIQAPSIAQAIQAAGGVTLSANLQQIEIRRRDRTKGVQRIKVNLFELAQSGDLAQNLTLRDGDSIYIPAADTIDPTTIGQIADTNLAIVGQPVNVALVGEVNRPGAYKLESGKDSGSRATLTQAIQQAGGITLQADLRQVQIRRVTRNGQPRLITVDVMKLIRDGDLNQDLLLQSGDTIRLVKAPEMTAEDLLQQGSANVSPGAIRINVIGEIKGGGALQVPPGSTLNQAILAAGGLDRRAAKSVELIRLNPNGTVTRRSIRVDLSRGVDSVNNPVLWNNDVIVVGRSGFTKFTDGVSDVLSPIFRLLPLQLLF